jgi:hypothetical protein
MENVSVKRNKVVMPELIFVRAFSCGSQWLFVVAGEGIGNGKGRKCSDVSLR